jgi:cell division protein ZapA
MDKIAEKNNTATVKKDKISIKLDIAGRIFNFSIKPQEEEMIRNASKLIKEKVDEYRKKYEGKDAQDALSMATLQFVLKLLDVTDKKQAVHDKLDDLNASIENYLQKHEKK